MATQTSKILSGKPVAQNVEAVLQEALTRNRRSLALATLQAGTSPDMQLYSKSLEKVLARFNIGHIPIVCESNDDVKKKLMPRFDDRSVTGIMVFSPIPKHIDAKFIFLNLPRKKDVEGRTFIKGNPFGVFSPTAKAVLALLRHLEQANKNFKIAGKHAVMVGHSDLVGKPTAMMLSDEGATVTICHEHTQEIQKHISEADILVVAIGKPGVIQPSWIKPGAVVIDVGENVVGGKLVGDVPLEAVLDKVSYISPVPGGVGPLTNLMVIENLIELDKYKDLLNGNH